MPLGAQLACLSRHSGLINWDSAPLLPAPSLVEYGQPPGRGGGPPGIAVPASRISWSCARPRTSLMSQ